MVPDTHTRLLSRLLFTSAVFALVTALSIAQDNYTVKMSMKIEGLPPEYAGFGEQEIVNYVKGDKYKTEVSSMMMTSSSSFEFAAHATCSRSNS